jgi:hypothetical protein
VQLRPQAAMKRVSLEGDFLDFAQFPELVILDPFGFAGALQQAGCVRGSGDATMPAEQLAGQPTRHKHAHNRNLRRNETCNENGGPRHSPMNVFGGCDILLPGLWSEFLMLLKSIGVTQ